MLRSLLIAVLSIAAGTAEQYSVPEKLSTLDKCAIAALAQDSKGALWITTGQGLFRYDGAELVCFDPGAKEAPLRCCGEDICYGGKDGIVRLTPSGPITYSCSQQFNALNSIIAAHGSEITVCFAHRIMQEAGDSLVVTTRTGVQSGKITAAHYYGDDLIVGTSAGNILKVEGNTLTSLYRCGSGVCEFFTDSRGRLWTGLSEGGVIRSTDLGFKDVVSSFGEMPRGVRCFCEDSSSSRIFLGTIDGLYSMGEDMEVVRDPSHAPSGHAIKTLLMDSDGTVWAGTHYSGVLMFNPHSPLRYVYGAHDFARLINAIVTDDMDRTWIVTDHYGLYLHDSAGRRLIPGTAEKKFKSATWMDGKLWLGEYMSGVSSYDPSTGEWRHFSFTGPGGNPSALSTYTIAQRDGVLFLGTNNGLYSFDPSSEKSITGKVHGLERRVIYSLDVSSDKTLWIGTTGLYSLSEGGVLDSVEQLEIEKCRSVDASGKNVVTAVQGKGFYILDEDGVTWHSASGCGMSSKEIYTVRCIADTMVVAGTAEGISFVRTGSDECLNYDSPLWAVTGTFMDGCISEMPDGRLWAGGADGIVEIDLPSICFDVREHPLVFDRLELNSEDRSDLLSGKTIRIPHDRNNVTLILSDFNLSGLRYTDNTVDSKEFNIHEEGVKSGYKLNFSALKRGVYNVCVTSRAVPSGEVLSHETKRLRILAPWYLSGAAIAAYLLLALALGAASYRKYLVQKKMIADLEAKYSSLLEIQKKYWSGTADASQVAGNEKDAGFLQDISSFVESNIGVTDVSVTMLCDHVCMGRTAFTEKVKELTGMPPRDFIEATKMKKAAQILSSGGKTISEVAYEFGFNSPKYFSIRFRKQFGIAPSEWMKR